MKSIILCDKERFTDTGDIIAVKFNTKSTRSFDKKELREFKEVLFGIIYSNIVYETKELLKSSYNDSLKVSDKINEINDKLNEEISIEDIRRVSSVIHTDDLQYALLNNQDSMCMILYLEEKITRHLKYSEKRGLMSHLCRHVIDRKPLCFKEGDLPNTIKKEQEETKGNGYLNFMSKAILEEQVIKGYKKNIRDILNSYKINIVDFDYIV